MPVAAATMIYGGIMIAWNAAGYIVAAADTAGLRIAGVADQQIDNTGGANGDLLVQTKRTGDLQRQFLFDNSTTAALDKDDIGKICYVEDDHTVAETSTNGVKAGRFMGFGGDPTGSDETVCWVEIAEAPGALGKYSPTTTAITTADGSDAATTQALANATKAKVNTLIQDVAALAAALN